MGEHFETLPELDYNRIPINRGKLITTEIPEDQMLICVIENVSVM